MTMQGGHEWVEVCVYDEYYDCILCPEYQPLRYATTNRQGYRIQKRPQNLRRLPYPTAVHTRQRLCRVTVQRHIWKDYEELADDARYTPEYRELYARRKETIERVFADAKENTLCVIPNIAASLR